MRERTQRLAKWIRAHGFKATVAAHSITIVIPWTMNAGTEQGFDLVVVHSMTEARDALGY